MEELENEKANLIQKLKEAKLKADMHTPSEDRIFGYLQKGADTKIKAWKSKNAPSRLTLYAFFLSSNY
ncbi:MAG: hypothetical protein C0P72_004655 [Clostridia bacterium]|nr:hypothetical protein [Clostridia bacterium]PZN10942.1 MAG: hypothetical protein DIU64_04310 [Caldicoprobacter oshimai]